MTRGQVNSVYLFFLLVCCKQTARAQEKPLTQAEAVNIALRQSFQAKAASAARDAALVQAQRDRPIARPTVSAIVSGTAQGPRVDLPGSQYVVVPEGAGRVDLIVEQVLYHGGLGAARSRYAAENALAQEDYRKALADLAQTTRTAYLNVLRADAGLQTAQDGVGQALRYQTLVQTQISAGVAKPIDAQTASSQLAEAQIGQRTAQSGAHLARLALNDALGRVPTDPVTLGELDALPVVPATPAEAVAFALQNRPELVTLELNLRMARAGVLLARSQSGPTVTARGRYSEQTPTVLNSEHYYGVTLEMSLPLLDGGKTRQDTNEAKAQVTRLEAERARARAGIALDVTQAWERMQLANELIDPARRIRLSAEATTAVAEKAYEVGQGTAIAVQAAQRELRDARRRELQATYDLYTAAINFAHAQGRDIQDADAVIGKKP